MVALPQPFDDGRCSSEWTHSSSPRLFQCSRQRNELWTKLCLTGKWTASIDELYPHVRRDLQLQPRSCRGRDINSTHLLQLLSNRTVAILGDSTAHNLWCSLVCHLMQEPGVTLSTRFHKGLGGRPVARMRFPPNGQRLDWVEPTRVDGVGNNYHLELKSLIKAAANSSTKETLVVLCK